MCRLSPERGESLIRLRAPRVAFGIDDDESRGETRRENARVRLARARGTARASRGYAAAAGG